MTQITASLALATLSIVESALREDTPINVAALGAANSGLSGLITQGTEPTPAQVEAVKAAITNLLVFDEEKAEEPVPAPVEPAPVEPVTDAPQPSA